MKSRLSDPTPGRPESGKHTQYVIEIRIREPTCRGDKIMGWGTGRYSSEDMRTSTWSTFCKYVSIALCLFVINLMTQNRNNAFQFRVVQIRGI